MTIDRRSKNGGATARAVKAAAIVSLLALASAFTGVSLAATSQRQSADEQKTEVVSHTAVKREPLPARMTPVPTRPRVESKGDCAPRYANGGHGSCINNLPCRGFGVLGEKGNPVCICYAREGGCGGGSRCDNEKLACVPEKESPFNRAESD